MGASRERYSNHSRPDGEWNQVAEILHELGSPPYLKRFLGRISDTASGTSYENLGDHELRRHVVTNFRTLVSGVGSRRPPRDQDDDTPIRAVGAARAATGVALSDLVTITMRAQQHMVTAFARLGRQRGCDDQLLAEAMRYIDAWAAWELRALMAGYRGEDSKDVDVDRAEIEDSLVRLLTGAGTAVEAAELAERCGLSSKESYHVLVMPLDGEGEARERCLAAAGVRLGPHGSWVRLADSLCVVTEQLPREVSFLVGAYGRTPIERLAGAYRVALRCAEAGARVGWTGVTTIERLSVRAALTADHEVVSSLRARYVDAVLAVSGGESILETVYALLENQRSVVATSKPLYVHANTIRYRLSRFERITGASLRDTATVAEVWWILQDTQSWRSPRAAHAASEEAAVGGG